MKVRFLLMAILAAAVFFLAKPALAENRYATCDQCGYCPVVENTGEGACYAVEPPGSWQTCVECLYPDLSHDPAACETVKIDPTTNQPPQPKKGRWYSMVGCLSTMVASGFSDEGGAAGLVQTFLNILFSVIGGVAFLYVLYASFLIMTAQGDPEKLHEGRQTLYAAVAGVIFALVSTLLVRFIGSGILRIPGFTQ